LGINRRDSITKSPEITIQANICTAGMGRIRAIAATNKAAIPNAPAIKKVGIGTSISVTQSATPISNHT
jgi:hypothetical protein